MKPLSTHPSVVRCLMAVLIAPAAFTAAETAGQSTRGFYLTTTVGLSSGASTVAHLSGVNHPTRCDRLLYTDPNDAPTDPECLSTEPSLDGTYPFEPEAGLGGTIAVGYAFGALRVEVEALQRHQIIHEAPFTVTAAAGTAITGKDTEWSPLLPPWGDLSEFKGRQQFVNVYYSLANSSRFTPYLGAGAGLSRMDFRFYAGFFRKSIAEGYLEAFGGSKSDPEASPEWQRRAAGTLSQLDAMVSETALGYQILGGVEVGCSEDLSLDLKARWVRVPDIDIDQVWLTIRSHKPVHADGTTPFESHLTFSPLGYVGVTVGLRYRL